MTQTEGPSTAYLDERLLDVEHELTIAPFRRLYAAFVPVLIAIAFFPLLKDVIDRQADGTVITYRHGTLWQMAGRGSELADIGIIVFGCVVALLLLASFSRVGRATLIATTAIAILGTVLLLRPDSAGPAPGLAPAGSAAIAILYCIAVVTIIHATRPRLWQR